MMGNYTTSTVEGFNHLSFPFLTHTFQNTRRHGYHDMISQEEIISALTDFDLERTDAILYITLLQTGSATVNTISTKLGIDKGKIYRSLHKLQNTGLVSSTFSNPTITNAVDPEKALSIIIQRKEEQILVMQKAIKKITQSLLEFKNPHEQASQVPSFYVIQGRPNIYARIGKIVEESAKTVYIVTTVRDLLRMHYTAIPEKIKISKGNGGKIRIITDEADDFHLLSDVDGLELAELRSCKLPSKSRIIVTQDKRLMMSGSMNESMSLNDDADSTLYTNSHEIVDNMYSFCNHLWSISKPLEMNIVQSGVNE
jgi:sugar-specific transcriptional regulator TrmB